MQLCFLFAWKLDLAQKSPPLFVRDCPYFPPFRASGLAAFANTKAPGQRFSAPKSASRNRRLCFTGFPMIHFFLWATNKSFCGTIHNSGGKRTEIRPQPWPRNADALSANALFFLLPVFATRHLPGADLRQTTGTGYFFNSSGLLGTSHPSPCFQ